MPPIITITAPVCPISRDQALPGMPGTFFPHVPRAVDLPSAIAAVNALILALAPLAGQGPITSGLQPPWMQPGGLGQDTPNQDGGGGLPKKKKRWFEKERKKCLIKYYAMLPPSYQQRDKDNWIIIERFTYLKWHDKVQKVDFEFDWPYDIQDQLEQNSEFISGDKGRKPEEIFRAQAAAEEN